MAVVKLYESGSTFAHTPMAIVAADATPHTLDEEDMVKQAHEIGKKFAALTELLKSYLYIGSVKVCGADFSIPINENPKGWVMVHWIVGLRLAKGLLMYMLERRLKMSVLIVMTDEQVERDVKIIREAINEVTEYDRASPGEVWHKVH
ncbi:uncharacterized protein PV06_11289 [Exophiala oligosperma]|uniref:Ornithine aminotransferase n=1 Tax=Exophiala oligosperma TaxID=215243 RepID=A0A0D2DL96_9EURO|nr:uncharacterized protein PV06_11289 [Exophiala oligosperma]KIW36474.1 hypothetical protein PV06_11289 [Exophiala oligosperma]